MNLVDKFYNFMQKQGLDFSDCYRKEIEDPKATLVSFGEESEDGTVYNVLLAFYHEDDSVEIQIRIDYSPKDLLQMYERLNKLNVLYSGITFVYGEGILSTKAIGITNGEIEPVMSQLERSISIAEEEFPNFLSN